VTRTPALRVCEPFKDGLEHVCPDRCQIRQCSLCLREVHYDPAASIPALGPETICCTSCVPIEAYISRSDGSWIEQPGQAGELHWCQSCGHRHYGRGPLGCPLPAGPGGFQGAQDPAFRLPPEAQN
jgi:hypothetical protein